MEIIKINKENNNLELLNMLYDNWAMTWEGLAEESFEEALNECSKNNVGYLIDGATMNKCYGLKGSNAYPNDLHIFAIKEFKGIAINYGARWFTDIVDNNAMRGGKKKVKC